MRVSLKMGEPFEQRAYGQMAAYVQYAAVLVDAVDALVDLTAQDIEFAGQRERLRHIAVEQGLLHVVENPGVAYGCAAHHYSVDPVAARTLRSAARVW